MKRVLEVVGRMDRAGQETFLMNLLRSCDSNEYEITFSVNTSHVGDYESEILSLGGKVWHNPHAITFKTFFKYLSAFREFLKTNGPFDVIHCHMYYFGGFILRVAKEEKIPIRVMHSHSTSDGKSKSFLRNFYRNISYLLIKKNATHFVGCGVAAYESLFREKCLDSNRILNNAILMDRFNMGYDERIVTRKSLGCGSSTKLIINVARFCKVKNHERIISIFNSYHSKNINSKLLLVGEGDRIDIIKKMVKNNKLTDAVLFLGIREDIPDLLNAADVLLMPSLFEGLPVSLIEAQAAGLPCVISNTITKEVDMGMNILQFLSLNATDEDWCEAICRSFLIDKPDYKVRYKSLGIKGYTVDATWKKLRLIYG